MEEQYEEIDARNGQRRRREDLAPAGATAMSDGRQGSELIPLETCLRRAAEEYDPEVGYVKLVTSLIRHLANELGVAA